MSHHAPQSPAAAARRAFTLIELLIVVAIIAILAAIAVPNFLEAQTRAKVSRSLADMKSLVTATEAYRVDYNKIPLSTIPGVTQWWGFAPLRLTSPVAYIGGLPTMAFIDNNSIGKRWTTGTGQDKSTAPYTYIQYTRAFDDVVTPDGFFSQPVYNNSNWQLAENAVLRGWIGQNTYHPNENTRLQDNIRHSSFFYYTSGPDGVDGTVWWCPVAYDPTNGTISWGDVYMFGGGDNKSGPTMTVSGFHPNSR